MGVPVCLTSLRTSNGDGMLSSSGESVVGIRIAGEPQRPSHSRQLDVDTCNVPASMTGAGLPQEVTRRPRVLSPREHLLFLVAHTRALGYPPIGPATRQPR
jgi:hypothetical protein